jgi:hypothetical protein
VVPLVVETAGKECRAVVAPVFFSIDRESRIYIKDLRKTNRAVELAAAMVIADSYKTLRFRAAGRIVDHLAIVG